MQFLQEWCWEQRYPWQHLLNKPQSRPGAQTSCTNTGVKLQQGKYNPGGSWPSTVWVWAKPGMVAAPSLSVWWFARAFGSWVLQGDSVMRPLVTWLSGGLLVLGSG